MVKYRAASCESNICSHCSSLIIMLATPSFQLSAILILIGSSSDNNLINNNDQLDNQDCGTVRRPQDSIQTRIVGGYGAESGAWPWQIAVLDGKKELICGGTMISSEFVLTAAHCVKNKMHIVAGEFNLVEKEGHEQERRVSKSFKHPQYNKNNVDNDIALLKLESPLELTPRVSPACLPEQSEELKPKLNATILGWGAVSYHRQPDGKPQVERDDMLYEAVVPVVDFKDCKNSYGDYLKGHHHVICAGYKEGGIDSCAGDSGGPLLVARNNKWYVYGVTSFGDECGKEGKYGIYSKTSAYVDWIKKIINKERTTSRYKTTTTARSSRLTFDSGQT